MTQVLIVALGAPDPALGEVLHPGALLGGSAQIALRQVPLEVEAVTSMPLPPAFRLARIFAGQPALASEALRTCHRRLGAIAPVTIAVHDASSDSAQPPAGLSLPGGVFFQPYTDTTLPLVSQQLARFAARGDHGAPTAREGRA